MTILWVSNERDDLAQPPDLASLRDGGALPLPVQVVADVAAAKALLEQGDVAVLVLGLSSLDDPRTALLTSASAPSEGALPVVVMGAALSESDEAALWQAGAFEVLAGERPTAASLMAALRRALRFHRLVWSFRRERAHLASALAHDLKNPLSAVLMTAHMLRSRLDEKDKPAIERIRRSGQRMHRMIQEMVDFLHLRQGTELNLRLNLSDLGKLCQNALDELTRAQPGHKIVFENGGGVSGMWDGERVEQLVFQILNHGLVSGLATEGALLKLEGDAHTEVVLRLSCRGPALPKSEVDLLLDPLAGDPRRAGARADIGLYIARAIAQAHGGDLVMGANAEGAGEIAVRLPRGATPPSFTVA